MFMYKFTCKVLWNFCVFIYGKNTWFNELISHFSYYNKDNIHIYIYIYIYIIYYIHNIIYICITDYYIHTYILYIHIIYAYIYINLLCSWISFNVISMTLTRIFLKAIEKRSEYFKQEKGNDGVKPIWWQ